MLKTRQLGYDGKGQAKITKGGDPVAAWRSVHNAPCILEGFIDFEREVSVVAARARDGKVECFEVTENEHRDHILKISRVPAKVTPALAREAQPDRNPHRQSLRLCRRAGGGNVRGAQGPPAIVLVNEIAPRVHNSGHWTIDGATVSQFEQHIRAVAGWPLAKPVRLGARVEMMNLIGAGSERGRALADGARAHRSTSTAKAKRARAARWGMSRGCGRGERWSLTPRPTLEIGRTAGGTGATRMDS